jgi:hypothetical protein
MSARSDVVPVESVSPGRRRVRFFGDLEAPVYALADVIGRKVVEEA